MIGFDCQHVCTTTNLFDCQQQFDSKQDYVARKSLRNIFFANYEEMTSILLIIYH